MHQETVVAVRTAGTLNGPRLRLFPRYLELTLVLKRENVCKDSIGPSKEFYLYFIRLIRYLRKERPEASILKMSWHDRCSGTQCNLPTEIKISPLFAPGMPSSDRRRPQTCVISPDDCFAV